MTDSRKKLGNLPFPRSGVLVLTRYGKDVAVFLTPNKFKELAGEDPFSRTRGTVITKYGMPIAVLSTTTQLFAMDLQRAMNSPGNTKA